VPRRDRWCNVALIQQGPTKDSTWFGSGIHESKYQPFKDIVSLAPSDLSPLHSHREFARIHALLDIKGIWFEHSVAVPEIFLFETTQYRGFETTGLARGWQNAGLDFFDGAQDHRYFVGMEGDARSGVKLGQPGINRVIQTFTLVRSQPSMKQPVGWDGALDGCDGPSDVAAFFIFGTVFMALVCSLNCLGQDARQGSVET